MVKHLALGVAILVSSTLLALGLAFIFIVDPFDWGAVRSDHFTWKKFEEVQIGQPIEAAVQLLGKPIDKPQPFNIINLNPGDPCETGKCMEYRFAGARFGAFPQEATVVVSPAGAILYKDVRQE